MDTQMEMVISVVVVIKLPLGQTFVVSTCKESAMRLSSLALRHVAA
jgi:hypothetical protein